MVLVNDRRSNHRVHRGIHLTHSVLGVIGGMRVSAGHSRVIVTIAANRRNTAQTRVYSLTLADAENAGDMVTGSTHSFIFANFVKLYGVKTRVMDAELSVVTPSGSMVICRKKLGDYPIEIQGRTLPVNLVVFDMYRFDVILGMDWLSSSFAVIDCNSKEVVFRPLDG
ncbi:uncharacterized protein LOC131155978 [Malania oleifera]|uniref:uncharacterized protein LOC131155978 n=1 Tax=Malania oleifera TaxID=397392 RepID=UPI0025ADF374|nr:uncharacterized protein LOC131155978 [Malania oleifera]